MADKRMTPRRLAARTVSYALTGLGGILMLIMGIGVILCAASANAAARLFTASENVWAWGEARHG